MAWILELPPLVLALVLCLSLARLAGIHGDSSAATWLNRGAVATVATTALPLVALLT